MEKSVQIFNHPEFGGVRVVGDYDNPRFCLADVCRILELDASAVMRRLDDGVISSHPITDSLGRMQNANFVNEDGLYDVILDSRKPCAKKFRKWLTSEVIPSIRKTGSYSLNVKTPTPVADIISDLGAVAENIQSLFAVKRGIALSQAIDLVSTYKNFDLSELKRLLPPATHETGYLNATKIADKLGIKMRQVNPLLEKTGLQVREGKSWRLTEAGKAYGEEMPYTRNGHSGYQIQWSESVISFLEAVIAA